MVKSDMALRIKTGKADKGIVAAVEEISGVDLSVCYQCKKCSSGCPVAELAESLPSEIMRRLHLGQGDELLESELIWTCASCETCSARCPMGIDVAAVIDALRFLALEKAGGKAKGKVPAFNRAFLNSVKRFGRTYDIGMIAAYKLKTGSLIADTEKFPTMLKKGKIALLPPSGANKKTVKRIFNVTKQNRGNKR